MWRPFLDLTRHVFMCHSHYILCWHVTHSHTNASHINESHTNQSHVNAWHISTMSCHICDNSHILCARHIVCLWHLWRTCHKTLCWYVTHSHETHATTFCKRWLFKGDSCWMSDMLICHSFTWDSFNTSHLLWWLVQRESPFVLSHVISNQSHVYESRVSESRFIHMRLIQQRSPFMWWRTACL